MRLELLGRHGVFSASEAARHGIDGHALARLVRAGSCLRLTRGWYAVKPGDELTRERRHGLTAIALGRQYAGRAAISHHSTVVLRDLPTYAVDLSTVHLTTISGSSGADAVPNASARRTGLVLHRPLPQLTIPDSPERAAPSRVGSAAGALVTVPLAVAIVQNGMLHGPEAALVSADAALNRSLVSVDQLTRAVEQFRGHAGIAEARAALLNADGRHESPGESRTAYVLRLLGFDLDPQFGLDVGGRRYRADFRIRGTRVLVEFDGAVKYSDARALFEEKQREDAIRRQGWVVVRIIWADLDNPRRLMRRIDEARGRFAG